jgi:hypothetical protein
VGIGGSVYHPPETPQLIEEIFNQITATGSQIIDPFEQAFFALVHIPYVQAFEDVNKRVSRLAANIPLVRNNLRPLSFIDVPSDLYTFGMLGIYEQNRIELLKDVFKWAYERSAASYIAVRQSLGDPDPFRLRYRVEIRNVIAEIIRNRVPKSGLAYRLIQLTSGRIPSEDVQRFMTVVQAELASLHEGNFARYQVKPSEFDAWQQRWNAARPS